MFVLQLVYTSVATNVITGRLIEDICHQAGENNRRDEITGILVTKGNRFVQALEGPKVTVEDTFMRLIVDERHRDVIVISRRMIISREFGNWDMRHCDRFDRFDRCADVLTKLQLIVDGAPDASRLALAEFLTSDI